jgi:hypothetical protein
MIHEWNVPKISQMSRKTYNKWTLYPDMFYRPSTYIIKFQQYFFQCLLVYLINIIQLEIRMIFTWLSFFVIKSHVRCDQIPELNFHWKLKKDQCTLLNLFLCAQISPCYLVDVHKRCELLLDFFDCWVFRWQCK